MTSESGTERDIPGTRGDSESPFETTAADLPTRNERYRRSLEEHLLAPARVIWSDGRARVGALIIIIYVLVGLIVPIQNMVNQWLIAGHHMVYLLPPPKTNAGPRLVAPFVTLAHPLGTDGLGQDLLTMLVYATPTMIQMLISGAVFTVVLGTVVGAVAGYEGGRVDDLLMGFADILIAIPGLPLVIVVATALAESSIVNISNPWLIGVVLAINAWAGLARAVRSEVLSLRKAEYVEASRVMGLKTSTVVRRDIIPNLMPYITMNFVQSGRNVLFASVGLYFLGVLPRTGPNWGLMMNTAYKTAGALYTLKSAHWLIEPMVALIGLTLGLTLFAQGSDRLFNPRVRARHVSTDDETNDESERQTATREVSK